MDVPPRKIIHIDMDAFYASVEMRDDPRLRGRPVAVAWGGERSVVLTASYPARTSGVGSAMPLRRALRLCPGLLVVPPRFEAYQEVSRQLRALWRQHTPLVEPLSLDEAYLDVTPPPGVPFSAGRLAQQIRAEVWDATGLTCTAGVSSNKFLAKLASGLHKPDGLTVIRPEQAPELLARLPVSAFHGIGPVTAARMEEHGIHTGADLRAVPQDTLVGWFGRAGEHFYQIARGQDHRPVEPDRPHKSIGVEETYAQDLRGVQAVRAVLPPLAATLEQRLARAGVAGRVLVLKVKFSDFRLQTRRLTVPQPLRHADELERYGAALVQPELLGGRAVRLVGLTAAGLELPGRVSQPPLFGDAEPAYG
ncbi:DNA polymerase IV [Deinococcus sonorensis]|uniref:DNA polymerase IV n=2 Tax=Deinococcus sonorensis TaxID=309891 RepID=A0AAU7U7U1_9DEIO